MTLPSHWQHESDRAKNSCAGNTKVDLPCPLLTVGCHCCLFAVLPSSPPAPRHGGSLLSTSWTSGWLHQVSGYISAVPSLLAYMCILSHFDQIVWRQVAYFFWKWVSYLYSVWFGISFSFLFLVREVTTAIPESFVASPCCILSPAFAAFLFALTPGRPSHLLFCTLIGTAPCTVNWHLYHATSPIEVFSAVFTFPSSHFFAFTTLFALWLCLNLFDTAIKASAVYRNTAIQYFLFVHCAARQIGWLQSTARNGNAV